MLFSRYKYLVDVDGATISDTRPLWYQQQRLAARFLFIRTASVDCFKEKMSLADPGQPWRKFRELTGRGRVRRAVSSALKLRSHLHRILLSGSVLLKQVTLQQCFDLRQLGPREQLRSVRSRRYQGITLISTVCRSQLTEICLFVHSKV